MLEELKKKVFCANLDLVKNGLVLYTWGNVSAIDREKNLVVIKPSGVDYGEMKPEMMVVLNMDGQVVEGGLKPSSDAPTHIELYKTGTDIGGIVHTHSTFATGFAQSGSAIKAYGTTHADYFYGDVPCTRALSENEVENEYERNTGRVIAETVVNAKKVPACLVKNHGVFAWGKDAADAVHNATVLEEIAKMAYITQTLGNAQKAPQYLLDKHYNRKHGKNATYGQKK